MVSQYYGCSHPLLRVGRNLLHARLYNGRQCLDLSNGMLNVAGLKCAGVHEDARRFRLGIPHVRATVRVFKNLPLFSDEGAVNHVGIAIGVCTDTPVGVKSDTKNKGRRRQGRESYKRILSAHVVVETNMPFELCQ